MTVELLQKVCGVSNELLDYGFEDFEEDFSYAEQHENTKYQIVAQRNLVKLDNRDAELYLVRTDVTPRQDKQYAYPDYAYAMYLRVCSLDSYNDYYNLVCQLGRDEEFAYAYFYNCPSEFSFNFGRLLRWTFVKTIEQGKTLVYSWYYSLNSFHNEITKTLWEDDKDEQGISHQDFMYEEDAIAYLRKEGLLLSPSLIVDYLNKMENPICIDAPF